MFEINGIKFGKTEKVNSSGTHRVIKPIETINRIKQALPEVKITRIADITGLDRLGVPVYSATVPDDKCAISVNNGKGITPDAAKVGAMMESIERFCAENLELPYVTGTYTEVSRSNKAIDPYSIPSYIQIEKDLHNEIFDWVATTEVFSGEEYLVPARLVGIPWERPYGSGVWIESTNGLGSGNILEEAICHALNEIIERDAQTLAILEAKVKPNLPHIIEGKDESPSNLDGYPIVSTQSFPKHLKEIAARIENEGVKLIVRDITSDISIPTFSAALVEEDWEGNFYCHDGAGTHPDADIALERAITEAAQSRLTDFQGTREDMSEQVTGQKPDETSFLISDRGPSKSFHTCSSYKNDTIEKDIRCILKKLRDVGFKEVFIANLTKKNINIPVVRVIIPGLETWSLNHFDIKGSVLGERGSKILELI